MWTSTSPPVRGKTWLPNHFVPLLPRCVEEVKLVDEMGELCGRQDVVTEEDDGSGAEESGLPLVDGRSRAVAEVLQLLCSPDVAVLEKIPSGIMNN